MGATYPSRLGHIDDSGNKVMATVATASQIIDQLVVCLSSSPS